MRSTRSAATAASSSGSTRKRRSAPATSASPAKRRTVRGGGASAAAADDHATMVTVAPPAAEGEWAKVMRRPREEGKFLDITLLTGGHKIAAHKAVLVALSPYLDGLLTSGLAESTHGGDELKIGDEHTDGRTVEALVDCMYSGELSLSRGSVSSMIRTANLFGVGTVEKAACDFFVDNVEPSTACEALAFAAAHATCGEHASRLHVRCVGYVVDHFAECGVESSFLELPCEAIAEVIGSDGLPVQEELVVAALRAWFDHDAAGRQSALKVLVPLVRWPLLPVEARLKLWQERLILRAQQLDDEAGTLVARMLLECAVGFAESNAAAACPRLKRRKGTVLAVAPLAFTAFSRQHYATGEDGALLLTTAEADDRPALCREVVMSSGQSCAEITVVNGGNSLMIGVGRPTLPPNRQNAFSTADFWGMGNDAGEIFHDDTSSSFFSWEGMESFVDGDVLRFLLDSDAGTLTVKKNGVMLGVAVSSGLTGDLCWAVCCYSGGDSDGAGQSVRIKALDPAEF